MGPHLTYRLVEDVDPPPGTPTAAMRVPVTDETFLGELIAFLERAGYRSQRARKRDPSLSESDFDAARGPRLELDLQLRAWEAAHPGTNARLGPYRAAE